MKLGTHHRGVCSERLDTRDADASALLHVPGGGSVTHWTSLSTLYATPATSVTRE